MRTRYRTDHETHHKDSLDGGLSLYRISTLIVLSVATGVLLGVTMKSLLAAVLWIFLMLSLVGLESLPEEERHDAENDRAETPVARKVLLLVNAFYCVGAASLAGLICLAIYSILY